MLNCKRILSVSFLAAVSLLSVSALADQGGSTTLPTASAPQNDRRTEFKCRFEGGGADKSAGWAARCKAEGKFEREDHQMSSLLNGDDDNMMTVRCEREDGDFRKIFEGRVKSREFDETIVLKGIRDHDQDRRRAPIIVISDVRHRDEDRRRFPAELTYSVDDSVITIPGECRLDKGGDNGPAPAPGTDADMDDSEAPELN